MLQRRSFDGYAITAKSVRQFLAAGSFTLSLYPALAGAAYSYDALGRLVSVRYDDGKQIVYQYDPAGNRTQHVSSATTINRQPNAGADTVTILESATQISLDPRTNDSDPDGNPLSVFSVANGTFGTSVVTGSGTGVTYTTTIKRSGVDTLTYVVSDGQGQQSSGTITVTLANLSPVTAIDAIAVIKNVSKTFDPRVNDSDPGGDLFSVTAASTPAHGTVIIAADGSSVSYTPVTNYVGTDSFTYTVTDIDGGSATATVNLTVT